MTDVMYGKEYIVKVTDDGECITVGELIRCKDCKYWMKTKKQCGYTYLLPQFNGDEYCRRAEPKVKP